jgi:hypothetical protein
LRDQPASRASLSAGWFGWGCIGCFAAHALVQVAAGIPHNLLWACHMACLLSGVGLVLRFAAVARAGVLLLSIGTPLWLINLLWGGEFFPTSLLTHVGGPICGWCGLRAMSVAPASRQPGTGQAESAARKFQLRRANASSWRRGWLSAVGSVALLLIASRAVTPAAANVNLVFAPWCALPGWQIGEGEYVAGLWLIWAGALWIAAQALQLCTSFRRPTASHLPSASDFRAPKATAS